MQVNGKIVSDTKVNNTGGWDNYEYLRHSLDLIELQAETQTIRLTANGTDDWQWNMDKLYLEKKSEINLSTTDFLLNGSDRLVLYPNSSSSFLKFKNLTKEVSYSIFDLMGKKIMNGKIAPDKPIHIQQLNNGTYFLIVGNSMKNQFYMLKIKENFPAEFAFFAELYWWK